MYFGVFGRHPDMLSNKNQKIVYIINNNKNGEKSHLPKTENVLSVYSTPKLP